MRTAQSRQKSYADKRRRPLEFEVGDMVFLKISPMKGIMRFRMKGKLNPRFIKPFEVLKWIRDLTYELVLFMLCLMYSMYFISYILNYEPLELCNNLFYKEIPVWILDHELKELRKK